MKLEVIDFIHNNENWKDLLSTDPYNITIKEDSDYYLLKYNELKSSFSLRIVNECRGLIIRKEDLEPVALSFVRFYNWEKCLLASDIDWSSAIALEKIDGAKIMVWYDKYNWHISTSGNIDAHNSPVGEDRKTNFGDLFTTIFNRYSTFDELDKNIIYTFEIITTLEQHIVPNNKDEIYLIGLRDKTTFEEISIIDYSCPFLKPKVYDISSLEDAQNQVSQLNENGIEHEGFVVVDKDFNRIKVKTEEYFILKKLKISKKNFLEQTLNSLDDEEWFRTYYKSSPAYIELADEIQEKRNIWYERAEKAITHLLRNKLDIDYQLGITNQEEWEEKKKQERMELAKYIQARQKEYSDLLFKYLDECSYNELPDIIDFIERYYKDLPISRKVKLIGDLDLYGKI